MDFNDNKIMKGFFWKSLERFGVLGVQFILRIVLARLLDPEHYGILALMMVFITIANVFVQSGFNTALIQNKDVEEEDYSSVFWISLGIAAIIYGIIFLSAPLIAHIYKMSSIVAPLRILALMLFPGALNSVQFAKVSREMDFKKGFYSNLTGCLVSGFVGIIIAYKGAGLWALVVQSILNVCVICLVMKFTVKLRICLKCNWSRIKALFSYGWKLVVSSLLNSVVEDIRSLVIGIKYNSDTLGNYNQGMQLPQYAMNVIQSSVSGVMLPAISEQQSEKAKAKQIMKNAISLGAFIIFPLMAGIAAVAPSFVDILLTSKWLGCVPYMRIYCLIFAFYPIYTCNLQAINAMGRSDIFLKLELIKQGYNLAVITIAVFFFQTPMAIAVSAVLCIPINLFINGYPNKKLIDYPISEQVCDFIQPGIISLVMFGVCYFIEFFGFSSIITILLQIAVGFIFYITASLIFKSSSFGKILMVLKALMEKNWNKEVI
ncbi:MAG: lipopolysaccharide biosynthesis protein [Lachnospiraceae bacterium]|nr:lipopolysaccharide biosynthesis protein [Lachnospiraceae bacterium]